MNNDYLKVKRNKGSGGVDKMEIPKENGKTRKLGNKRIEKRQFYSFSK